MQTARLTLFIAAALFAAAPQAQVLEQPAVTPITEHRITSYNVCYTKLLRSHTWRTRSRGAMRSRRSVQRRSITIV